MPFTPYHFGPSGFLGLVFKKWIDIPVFILANVIVDIEVLIALSLGFGWVHRYCHTLLGGAVVGLLWGVCAYPLRHFFEKIMHILQLSYKPSFWKMAISGSLGALLHVLLDGLYHLDARIFWPNRVLSLPRIIDSIFHYHISQELIKIICIVLFSASVVYLLSLNTSVKRMISKYWDLFTLRKRCSLILISIAIFIVVALVIFNNSSETKARFSPRSTIVVDPSTSYKTISDSEVIEPFVRSGAFQIESISYDNDFLSRAYINGDGDYVVIVKCNSGGNFSISGLASGYYAIRYTTANQSEVNLSNQTIYSGQPVVAEIPKAGVLVVYAVPSSLDDQIPTTPMDLTAYYLSPFKVKLKWEVSTDNTTVAGYIVCRDGVRIGFSQTDSFEDKKVRPTASYSYSVLAYDTSANKSSLSKPMIVVIPQLIEDKDLLGYWKFDEGYGSMAKDISKNSRDGTVIGAEWTSATNGYVMDFDGVDDYVKINSDSFLDNLAAITMIAWIYPRVDSHWHVLDKGDGDKRLYAEGIKRMLEGRIRYSDMHAFSESKSDTIILNTWQHVALTWSRKTNKVRLFHNGLEVKYRIQDIGSGSVMDDSDYPFTIGTRGALGIPMFFTGYIDEVQLYKRALSSQEIQAVYNWSAHQFSSRSEPVK